jgi:tetratricopeptide (TPR) repeat protein
MVLPDHSHIYYHMARAYSALKDHKEAIKSLRRARELLPNHVPSGILLTEQYLATGKFDRGAAVNPNSCWSKLPRTLKCAALWGTYFKKALTQMHRSAH